MSFQPGGTASVVAFVAMAITMLAVMVVALRRGGARPGHYLAVFGGLAAFVAVVASGAPVARPLPVVPLLFAAVVIGAVAFALSSVGRRLSATGSLAILVGVQAFRLPLELVLHDWVRTGTIPETMTWTGQNFDIVAGALALIAAPLVQRARVAGWIAQLVGVVLLVNVMRVVVMSSPLPFAWQVEPPLRLIENLPYALIGPLFVAPAVAAHIMAIRRLLRRER